MSDQRAGDSGGWGDPQTGEIYARNQGSSNLRRTGHRKTDPWLKGWYPDRHRYTGPCHGPYAPENHPLWSCAHRDHGWGGRDAEYGILRGYGDHLKSASRGAPDGDVLCNHASGYPGNCPQIPEGSGKCKSCQKRIDSAEGNSVLLWSKAKDKGRGYVPSSGYVRTEAVCGILQHQEAGGWAGTGAPGTRLFCRGSSWRLKAGAERPCYEQLP